MDCCSACRRLISALCVLYLSTASARSCSPLALASSSLSSTASSIPSFALFISSRQRSTARRALRTAVLNSARRCNSSVFGCAPSSATVSALRAALMSAACSRDSVCRSEMAANAARRRSGDTPFSYSSARPATNVSCAAMCSSTSTANGRVSASSIERLLPSLSEAPVSSSRSAYTCSARARRDMASLIDPQSVRDCSPWLPTHWSCCEMARPTAVESMESSSSSPAAEPPPST